MPTGIYDRKTTKLNKGLFQKGQSSWNKGIKIDRTQYPKMGHFKPHTRKAKRKISLHNCRWLLGKHHSEATRKKIGKTHEREKCHFWKGGITSVNKALRNSFDFKSWRGKIFERDDYTCQHCLVRGGNGKKVILHPHHIKSFSEYPKLRFEVDNGLTLCVQCHRVLHKNIF